MLEHLIIKNFAIIEDIEIFFKDGMNCIVGETGAGKSIIIDALSLLKGEKSNFDKIRNGEQRAFIEGSFYIEDKSLIFDINNEFDNLIEDDGLLNVSRILDINGKSYCKINYHSVPLSVLKKIMEQIIDIHSQHKDNSFFDEKKQIYFIDKYALKMNNTVVSSLIHQYDGDIYVKYAQEFEELLNKKRELNNLLEKQSKFDDLELLQYQYEELEKANIQPNEIEDIEQELKNLESFEDLANSISLFEENYNEISSLLFSSKKALNNIKTDIFDEESAKFNDLYYEFDDLNSKILDKFNHLSDNQSKLEYLRERKSTLYGLRRKYGRTTEDILNYFKNVKEEIELISNFDYIIEKQKQLIREYEEKCNSIALDLRKIRKIASAEIQSEINRQLKELLLENADFLIEINEIELNKNGLDEIVFKLRANVGGKYLSLSSTASLGETSRINLALKTVFNLLHPVGTMIFDEIDTGISGRVAVGVSKKIHDISLTSQTIVITHLPQVSARGDHHYFISKYVENNLTKTKIDELTHEQVIDNIAYMMTGKNPTEESVALAKQLIDSLK